MPCSTITEIPSFATPEEHRELTGSTPASFAELRPVLRHKEENVSVTLDPPLEGFSAEDGAQGTLFVIESALFFMSANGRGLQIDYPSITLHAISRAESGPCVYCQLDDSAGQPAANGAGPQEGDEYTSLRELSIVPQSAASLEPIFEALSLCASLHPDPNDDEDDAFDDALIDGQEGQFETFTGGEEEELSEVGRAALAHLESIIVYPEGHKPQANGTGEEEPERTSPGVEDKS
ncbi:regulator of volume decrease after cellular swelling-domain-containing protein [Schizophyllum fasciatum]